MPGLDQAVAQVEPGVDRSWLEQGDRRRASRTPEDRRSEESAAGPGPAARSWMQAEQSEAAAGRGRSKGMLGPQPGLQTAGDRRDANQVGAAERCRTASRSARARSRRSTRAPQPGQNAPQPVEEPLLDEQRQARQQQARTARSTRPTRPIGVRRGPEGPARTRQPPVTQQPQAQPPARRSCPRRRPRRPNRRPPAQPGHEPRRRQQPNRRPRLGTLTHRQHLRRQRRRLTSAGAARRKCGVSRRLPGRCR